MTVLTLMQRYSRFVQLLCRSRHSHGDAAHFCSAGASGRWAFAGVRLNLAQSGSNRASPITPTLGDLACQRQALLARQRRAAFRGVNVLRRSSRSGSCPRSTRRVRRAGPTRLPDLGRGRPSIRCDRLAALSCFARGPAQTPVWAFADMRLTHVASDARIRLNR